MQLMKREAEYAPVQVRFDQRRSDLDDSDGRAGELMSERQSPRVARATKQDLCKPFDAILGKDG